MPSSRFMVIRARTARNLSSPSMKPMSSWRLWPHIGGRQHHYAQKFQEIPRKSRKVIDFLRKSWKSPTILQEDPGHPQKSPRQINDITKKLQEILEIQRKSLEIQEIPLKDLDISRKALKCPEIPRKSKKILEINENNNNDKNHNHNHNHKHKHNHNFNHNDNHKLNNKQIYYYVFP